MLCDYDFQVFARHDQRIRSGGVHSIEQRLNIGEQFGASILFKRCTCLVQGAVISGEHIDPMPGVEVAELKITARALDIRSLVAEQFNNFRFGSPQKG